MANDSGPRTGGLSNQIAQAPTFADSNVGSLYAQLLAGCDMQWRDFYARASCGILHLPIEALWELSSRLTAIVSATPHPTERSPSSSKPVKSPILDGSDLVSPWAQQPATTINQTTSSSTTNSSGAPVNKPMSNPNTFDGRHGLYAKAVEFVPT